MPRPYIAVLALAAGFSAACGSAPHPVLPPGGAVAPLAKPSAASSSGAARSEPSAKAGERRLKVSLKALVEPEPAISVEVVAEGPPAELRAWSISEATAGALVALTARDEKGQLGVGESARGGGLSLVMQREPVGAVHLAYAVKPSTDWLARPLAPQLDPDRFRASGEAILALPEAFDEQKIPVSLAIDAAKIHPSGTASSLGVGASREAVTRGRDLRGSTFVAGHLGHAVFEAAEGHDEAAWLGYTSFDPRPIAADVAAFRTAVRDVFGDKTTAPQTLLLVADSRAKDAFIATRRASSVLVHVGVGQPWSAPLRIAVAHEVIHAWIGGQIWVGPDTPGREAEAYWFTEGVARFLARELLLRFGLISPTEYLDEVHALLGVLATSRLRGQDNAALARAHDAPGALPLLVARGAVYATRVDALIRARTKGARSLDTLLRALLAKARAARAALPDSAWTELCVAELGEGERRAFDAHVIAGADVKLPDTALGPCFAGATRTYEAFDVGFDDAATLASPKRAVIGLRPEGPAARAGLRETDVVRKLELSRGRSDVPVVLTIERDGSSRELRYRPAGPSRRGQGFTRKADVRDDDCGR